MERIVVMGASQGGVDALRTVVRGLPADFAAPVLVVLHVGPQSLLPTILNDLGRLPAAHAHDGDEIRPGHIFVAPPDHHMLVNDGRLELTRGPRENWARPALDPLFRTAAASYGEAVVGVVLTGRLNDGAAGLYEIKRQGGVAIVQEPGDAAAPSMPQSALAAAPVDFRLPLAAISEQLVQLVAEAAPAPSPEPRPHASAGPWAQATPPTQSCPECGGAMREETLGPITRFRCHIGHVMTAEILAAAQVLMLESQFAVTVRLLKERAALCRTIADKRAERGEFQVRDAWLAAAEEAAEREGSLRALVEAGWLHPETLLEPDA